jgi:tRNA-specific 2-thiouridylase
MSGGVDSSIAAFILKRAGHEVIGMTLRVHDDPERQARLKSCCAPKDIHDARAVAQTLGIAYYAIDMRESFHERVIVPFVDDYVNGRTPNPCVRCNSELKFGLLYQRAKALGCEAVATGHYARIEATPEGFRLLRGRDADKDQSYFLFALTQSQLARTVFPLGDLTKVEVRKLAEAAGLPTAQKPESQEICFVPDNDYAAIVSRLAAPQDRSGAIVDHTGDVLAKHPGIHHFTVGQRRGLGVTRPQPLYVTRIDPATREVEVGPPEALLRRRFIVSPSHWLRAQSATARRCQVAIRSRHPAAPADLLPGEGSVTVNFLEPQRAITPGQAAVFYEGEEVLGGGWIASC